MQLLFSSEELDNYDELARLYDYILCNILVSVGPMYYLVETPYA